MGSKKTCYKAFLASVLWVTGMLCTTVPVYADNYHANLTKEYTGSLEQATLEVFNDRNELQWSIQSATGAAQLSAYALLESGDDTIYFVDNGTITAYDAASGSVLWCNYDFGGSVAGDCFVIQDGTLYVGGYYGPDYCVIAPNGMTISRVDTLQEGTYWPYRMEMNADGDIEITFESDGSILTVPQAAYINDVETEPNASGISKGSNLQIINCDQYISLRSIPNDQGEVLAQMPKGESCTFLRDAGNDFLQVRYQTNQGFLTGYAKASYLEVLTTAEIRDDCVDNTCPIDGFDGYDYDICELALNHYEGKTGYRPGLAYITEETGSMVTIHLVDSFPDHEATCDWYEIDRNTLSGTNFLGEEVILEK